MTFTRNPRWWLAIGAALAGGAALTIALTLIPRAVHSTTLLVWSGVGLFGLAAAVAGGVCLFAAREVESYRRDLEFSSRLAVLERERTERRARARQLGED